MFAGSRGPLTKRQKVAGDKLIRVLQTLVHSNGVSRVAMRNIIAGLRDVYLDDPDASNLSIRYFVDRAARDIFSEVSIRQEFEYESGNGSFTLHFADPNALLFKLASETKSLRDLYADAWRRKPATREAPWNLVVAFDELTAGNTLRLAVNQRKVMRVYFTFLELGPAALCSVNAWVGPLAIRCCELKQIQGGFSVVMRRHLRCHLLADNSKDGSGLRTSGVPLRIHDQDYLLYARLAVLMSDGEGHQLLLDWKGASSLRPYVLCSDVLKKQSGITDDDFVEISCDDTARFKRVSRKCLFDDYDSRLATKERVAAGRVGVTRFTNLEKTLGYNANANGILADVELRDELELPDGLTCD